MNNIKTLLLLPHLQVSAANAVSGPLTWGFPSPTAFTGFAHALERKLGDWCEEGIAGIGIVCHHFEPQVFEPPGSRTKVFCLTRNPVGKDGKTSALVEEGKAHLEVSLVLALNDDIDDEDYDDLLTQVSRLVGSMRLAGGTIRFAETGWRRKPVLTGWADDTETQQTAFRQLSRTLLPGFALVLRDDRMQSTLNNLRATQPQATALDAVLDHARLHFSATKPGVDNAPAEWQLRRREGWTVPLTIGYGAISDLYQPGEVRNTRDAETPFCFVESLYSIGEWIGPHRLQRLEQMLWTHTHDEQHGLYLCDNRYTQYLSDSHLTDNNDLQQVTA